MRKINNDCSIQRIWSFICMSIGYSRLFSILVPSFVIFVFFFQNAHTNLTRKMANFIVNPFEIDLNSMKMKNNTMNEIDRKLCSCQTHQRTANNNVQQIKEKPKLFSNWRHFQFCETVKFNRLHSKKAHKNNHEPCSRIANRLTACSSQLTTAETFCEKMHFKNSQCNPITIITLFCTDRLVFVLMCWYLILYIFKRHMHHMQWNAIQPNGPCYRANCRLVNIWVIVMIILNCWKCVYMFYVLWVLFLCPFATAVSGLWAVGVRSFYYVQRTYTDPNDANRF